MLEKLCIRNVALVEEVDLNFKSGLNVITGETGAGKSILIGSIGLALGDRAHSDVVNEKKAEVEAIFSSENGGRRLRREVRLDGRTKAWVDGNPSTIGTLKDEAQTLVDLTAQREGATLLDPTTHLEHLDRFAGLTKDVEQLSTFYYKWQALLSEIKTLKLKIQRLKETEELATYQLEEIEKFNPQDGEDEKLESEIRLLEGAETLIVGLSKVEDVLDQGDDSIADRLSVVANELLHLVRIDESLESAYNSLSEITELLRENASEISQRRDKIELDPERLATVRERYDELNRLIKKYGGSFETLLAKRDELNTRKSDFSSYDREQKRLLSELNIHVIQWEKLCLKISESRKKKASGLKSEMEKGLQSLGVEKPVFEIKWLDDIGETIEFPYLGMRKIGPKGLDNVEFQISFNPGHDPKPLHRVASGGELSRVMLLLKGFDPPVGNPQVMVFDEIDTGISGGTARQVGRRLKELSKLKQVLLVTHLPQIASFADNHIVVEKETGLDSTNVFFRSLEIGSDAQVDEIARLVGGDKITDTARATARELIQG